MPFSASVPSMPFSASIFPKVFIQIPNVLDITNILLIITCLSMLINCKIEFEELLSTYPKLSDVYTTLGSVHVYPGLGPRLPRTRSTSALDSVHICPGLGPYLPFAKVLHIYMPSYGWR